MSTACIYDAVTKAVKRRAGKDGVLDVLDVGAGGGGLLKRLSSEVKIRAHACDFHTEMFKLDSVPIKKVDLNQGGLPYPDSTFDIVTCSEVIEHLDDYRALFKEARRVLKKGGLFVVTTPNVLNMKSRLRFFVSGFYNLFGPLPFSTDRLYSVGRHVTPVPYFYLAHALFSSGFTSLELDVDKRQRSSLAILALARPALLIGRLLFMRAEKKKYKTLTPENERSVKEHFSTDVMTGRTIVVSAVKG